MLPLAFMQEDKWWKCGMQAIITIITIVTDISLSAGDHRKGKYIPLRGLTSRLGASKLLALQPTLIHQLVGPPAPLIAAVTCPVLLEDQQN